jgi:phage tail-like protein
MGTAGQAKNLDVAGHFRVRIDGFKDTDFAECDGLEAELEVAEYSSGGEATKHKQPTGKVVFPDITLRRASCQDYDAYLWFSSVVQLTAAQAGADAVGLTFPNMVRNIEICQLDADGSIKKSYTARCFPKKFKPGSWKGDSKEFLIEELVLTDLGWDLTG